MSIITALIVGAPVLVAGLPIAPHPVSSQITNAPLRRVDDTFAARKDAYLQKSRQEMDEWRSKIHIASERAEAKGHEASARAQAHLNRAWSATERNWQMLQTESAEGWDRTKGAYERSTAELRAQWHKIHPEDND
jgi:hypothetical protein